MKRKFFYIACFTGVFFISLVVHTPISFALKYLPPISGLKIEAPIGTIWNGQAQKIYWRGENLGHASWRFQAQKMFSGKASYHIRFGRESDMKLIGKGDIGYSLSGLFAENVVASIPVDKAMKKLPISVPVTTKGNIELSINEYYYAKPWCDHAKGSLVWSESKITSPLGALDLGTVVTDLICEDNVISIIGEHNNNQMAGALTAKIQSNMRYDISTWFKPNADFPSTMKSQLKWLGAPNNKGEYPFTYAGKLN